MACVEPRFSKNDSYVFSGDETPTELLRAMERYDFTPSDMLALIYLLTKFISENFDCVHDENS